MEVVRPSLGICDIQGRDIKTCGESSVACFVQVRLITKVDWALPMTPPAQCVFFQKVWKSFTRASTGVPLLNKKRYRMTPEELMVHRNLSVLFSQTFSHLNLFLCNNFLKTPNVDVVLWVINAQVFKVFCDQSWHCKEDANDPVRCCGHGEGFLEWLPQ